MNLSALVIALKSLGVSTGAPVSFARTAGTSDDVGSTYTATAGPGITVTQWQWTLNGSDIVGATNASYTTIAGQSLSALNVYAKVYQLAGKPLTITQPVQSNAFLSNADASRFLRFGTWGVNDAETTGRLLPTTSWDTIHSTLYQWLGIPDALSNGVNPLKLVLPNIDNFPTRRLSFLP